jgi:hypothetical protein
MGLGSLYHVSMLTVSFVALGVSKSLKGRSAQVLVEDMLRIDEYSRSLTVVMMMRVATMGIVCFEDYQR